MYSRDTDFQTCASQIMAFGKLTLWYSCPAQGENGGKECKDSEKKQTEDCHFLAECRSRTGMGQNVDVDLAI